MRILYADESELSLPSCLDTDGRVVRERCRFREFSAKTEISKGHFNSVYKARHSRLGDVAVKILLVPGDRRELQYLTQLLPHNNVISIIGVIGSEYAFKGYVMEYISCTLDKVIHKADNDTALPDFSLLEALEIGDKICNGVLFLHTNRISNLGINPKRILVSNDLRCVKVSGFGSLEMEFDDDLNLKPSCDLLYAASHSDDGADSGSDEYFESETFISPTVTVNAESELIGILPYEAPELIRVNYLRYGDYGGKCDVYSVAVTLCELFTKEHPYGMIGYESAYELFSQISEYELRPSTELLDHDIKIILERGWRKKSEERPKLLVFYKDLQTPRKERLDEEYSKKVAELRKRKEERELEEIEKMRREIEAGRKKEGDSRILEVKRAPAEKDETRHRRFWMSEFFSKTLLGNESQGSSFGSKHSDFGKVVLKLFGENKREDLRVDATLPPHPNVVLIYGFLHCETSPLRDIGYVMEHMYTSLDQVIHKDYFDTSLPEYSLSEAVEIIHKICCGVHYLHQHGIWHGNIKPSNMLCSRDLDLVKVSDYGNEISKNQRRRSAPYIAPEVIDNSSYEYTEKCDVYSAAITFWELLHKRAYEDEACHENTTVCGVISFRTRFIALGPMRYPYGSTATVEAVYIGVKSGVRPNLEVSPLSNQMKQLLRRAWHPDTVERPTILEIHREIDE